jgi:hypothetical protein
MGLIAATLGLRRRLPHHETAHVHTSEEGPLGRLIRERLGLIVEPDVPVGVPGPPPIARLNSAASRLPDLPLVDAGMRPITGGRRSSF